MWTKGSDITLFAFKIHIDKYYEMIWNLSSQPRKFRFCSYMLSSTRVWQIRNFMTTWTDINYYIPCLTSATVLRDEHIFSLSQKIQLNQQKGVKNHKDKVCIDQTYLAVGLDQSATSAWNPFPIRTPVV